MWGTFKTIVNKRVFIPLQEQFSLIKEKVNGYKKK